LFISLKNTNLLSMPTDETFGSTQKDSEGVIHPGLFAELQKLIDETSAKHHGDLKGQLGIKEDFMGSGELLSGDFFKNSSKEETPQDHELVAEQHHQILLDLFRKLLTMHPDDLMLAYQVISRFERKLDTLKQPGHFESKGHSLDDAQRHREKAEKLHTNVNQIRNQLRDRIEKEAGKTLGEGIEEADLSRISSEIAKEHLDLKPIFLRREKGDEMGKSHTERLHAHVGKSTKRLHGILHGHKEDVYFKPDAGFDSGKLDFQLASGEMADCFNNPEILPWTIQQALKLSAKSIFAGVSNYALIGSAAAVLNYPRPRGISDVDFNFTKIDLPRVWDNLEKLRDEGLVTDLKRGHSSIYGSSEKISCVIKVETIDQETGEPVVQYVDFEAFAEATGSGISQLGYIDNRTLKQVPVEEGVDLNVMGAEGLMDQYVINFLAEFDLDSSSDSAFDHGSKDMRRLLVLHNRFGLEVLEGIIVAIAQTRGKYLDHSQHPKIQRLFEKSEKVESFLRDAHAKYEKFYAEQGITRSDVDKKEVELEVLNSFDDFTELVKTLRTHGLNLNEYIQLSDTLSDPEDRYSIFEKAAASSKTFSDLVKRFYKNPLMYFAVSRYVFEPLERLAQKVEESLPKSDQESAPAGEG
jgi:hypothetical protein